MYSAQQIADALGGKQHGKNYRAPCPAHNSSNPTTLSISDSTGRLLVHCFAGCSQEQVIAALTDIGLWSNSERHSSFVDKQKEEHARIVLSLAESQLRYGKPLSAEDRSTVDEALRLLRGISG